MMKLRIKGRREFSVAHKTYRLALSVMKNHSNGLEWDEGNNYSKVLIVFLVKNIHRLQSIILLCKHGLAKDAMPLMRGMFEELVDLNYMSANKMRVNDFIDYDTYQRHKLGSALINSKSEGIDRVRVTTRNNALDAEWNKIKHRFTYKSKDRKERIYKRWTRDDVRKISIEVGLGEMYEYLFALPSTYVHSGPIAADDYVLGKMGNDVVFAIGASPTLVSEVLATSSGMYLDMLRIADKDFNMGLDEQIKVVETMLNNAAAARKELRKESTENHE